MEYKEYALGYEGTEKEEVNLDNLKVEELMPLDSYIEAHKNLPILCHDVLIEYDGGIFLMVRDNPPGKGVTWPVGGRVLRGVDLSESLKIKVKKECGLEIEEPKIMGISRTYFNTDPFGHGKGTDTINFMFVAKGKGKINLDELHADWKVIKKEEFERIKKDLHPYVSDALEEYFSRGD